MDKPRDRVISQLEDIRLRLLDLTNRNRLLNFKYRGGCVRIVDVQPEEVFDYLVRQGKQMAFLPLPEETESPGEDRNRRVWFGFRCVLGVLARNKANSRRHRTGRGRNAPNEPNFRRRRVLAGPERPDRRLKTQVIIGQVSDSL